jgi:hypothetical protein
MAAGVVDQILLGQQGGQQKLVGLVDQAVVVLMILAQEAQEIPQQPLHHKETAVEQE